MNSSLNMILGNSLALSGAVFALRDFALLPIQFGNAKGCYFLQAKVDQLRKKIGIPFPIYVTCNDFLSWAAHGSAFSRRGGITVPLSETMPKTKQSDDTQIALLAHEISHITQNDGPWLLCVITISFVAFSVFFGNVLPGVMPLYSCSLALIPTLIFLFEQIIEQEREADLEACRWITRDQKEALVNWLKKQKVERQKFRNDPSVSLLKSLWRKIWYDRGGNTLLEKMTHPTLRERIRYIHKQIR